MIELRFFNRQRTRRIDGRFFARIARCLLEELLNDSGCQLAVHLITASEMARLNKHYLGHEGSTDVITFNHQEGDTEQSVYGEIFISIDDAVANARRFRATWVTEAVRYLVHGVLHLHGYDDHAPGLRRVMKQRENQLLKKLCRRFDLGKLDRS